KSSYFSNYLRGGIKKQPRTSWKYLNYGIRSELYKERSFHGWSRSDNAYDPIDYRSGEASYASQEEIDILSGKMINEMRGAEPKNINTIIEHYFGGKPILHMAKDLGISRQAVHLRISKVIDLLKNSEIGELYRQYFEDNLGANEEEEKRGQQIFNC